MRGLTGMGVAAVAVVAGAIMRYAISATATGFSIHTVGNILILAGVIGFAIAGIIFATTRESSHHVTQSKTSDSMGNSVVTTKETR